MMIFLCKKKEKTYASKGEHGRENFGGGGITKVMKSYQGGITLVKQQRGDQPYFTVLSPNSSDPPRR